MVLLLVFMQLTRDLFAIAKFCYTANTSYLPLPRKAFTRRRYRSTTNSDNSRLIAAYYSFIDPERMKGWVGLVGAGLYSGLFTHINGYLSAAGPVQAREGSPVRDRRSTTEPPNQLLQLTRLLWLVAVWRGGSVTQAFAVGSERRRPSGDWYQTVRTHHACAESITLATIHSANKVQDHHVGAQVS